MNGDNSPRSRAQQPGLKVLFTTGYTRNAIVHNGMLDPGTHLITKPFSSRSWPGKSAGSTTRGVAVVTDLSL